MFTVICYFTIYTNVPHTSPLACRTCFFSTGRIYSMYLQEPSIYIPQNIHCTVTCQKWAGMDHWLSYRDYSGSFPTRYGTFTWGLYKILIYLSCCGKLFIIRASRYILVYCSKVFTYMYIVYIIYDVLLIPCDSMRL